MKKWIWIGVVAVVAIFFYATYNGFVNREEGLKSAWSNVETQYQRRADLIPNLVNTVKGYAAHETQTLNEVTEARARATSINLSADDLTPERLAQFQRAQAEVRSALGRLIAVSESYPTWRPTRISSNCRPSSKGPRTALPSPARTSTPRRSSTTFRCAASRPTSSRGCSASARSPISSRPKGPRPLRRSPSK